MQERVNEKTVAIAVQATRLTGRMLARIGELYLRHVREKHRDNKIARSRDPSTFKQNQADKVKIKTLMQEGDGVSNVEIKDDSIKVFERLARRNGIRYAVKKDKNTQPPTYYIFFKGKSAEVIEATLKEFTKAKLDRSGRHNNVKSLLDVIPPKSLSTYVADFKKESKRRARALQDLVDQMQENLATASQQSDDIMDKTDELHKIEANATEGNMFFQLISELQERTAIIITTNKGFGEYWLA